jgi:2'-5' RNA ligase
MALAIVAIPKDDERVWKISSEKIPHLTLLMLGDNVNAEATALIVQFVEHAAKTTLHRFGLSVDKRGVLGAEYADVLFFEKSKWNLDRISDFRTNLLGDTAIKEAYLTTDQFDGWTPHLTLGYPATPAHTDDKDHEIGYVSFDKIAVWTDDYTGPTFDLSSEWDEDVAWSADMGIEAFMHASGLAGTKLGELMHYGKQGMRWGVRRKLSKMNPGDTMAMDDYVNRYDSKWKAKVEANPKMEKIAQIAARDANRQTQQLNKDYKERGLNIKKDALARTRYDAEVGHILNSSLDKAAYKTHGLSPSRMYEVKIDRLENDYIGARIGPRFNVKIAKQLVRVVKKQNNNAAQEAKLTHAEDLENYNFEGLVLTGEVDEDGFITYLDFPEFALTHHGVKGQRWGIRRERGSDGTVSGGLKGLRSKSANATPKPGDRKIVVESDGSSTVQEMQSDGNWRKVEMSADAERIVKSSLKPGYDLSTKEIQDAVNRANLVKQYDTMFNPKKDPNAELQAKVQALELKMKYSQLQSQMNPSKLDRVDRLVKSASSGFDAYNKLNKASDGRLNQGIESFLFGNRGYTPKHAIDLKTMKAKK